MKKQLVKVTERIPVEERAALGEQLAQAVANQQVFYEQRKLKYAEFKQTDDAFKEKIHKLAEEVNTGERTVEIECVREPHTECGEAWLRRVDNDEVIKKEPINDEDRQAAFSFAGVNEPTEQNVDNLVAGFFASNEEEKQATEGDNPEATTDENTDTESFSLDSIQFGEPHPQCNRSGSYLMEFAKPYHIEMNGLHFVASVYALLDQRDGQWRSTYKFGSTEKPVFREEKKAERFCPDDTAYRTEYLAIDGAIEQMTDAIKQHEKWAKISSGRQINIIGEIERFAGNLVEMAL